MKIGKCHDFLVFIVAIPLLGKCFYIAIGLCTLLNSTQQWQWQRMTQTLNSENTSHISIYVPYTYHIIIQCGSIITWLYSRKSWQRTPYGSLITARCGMSFVNTISDLCLRHCIVVWNIMLYWTTFLTTHNWICYPTVSFSNYLLKVVVGSKHHNTYRYKRASKN